MLLGFQWEAVYGVSLLKGAGVIILKVRVAVAPPSWVFGCPVAVEFTNGAAIEEGLAQRVML